MCGIGQSYEEDKRLHGLVREDAVSCRVGGVDLDSGKGPVNGTMMFLYMLISRAPPSPGCINLNLANAAMRLEPPAVRGPLTARLPAAKAASFPKKPKRKDYSLYRLPCCQECVGCLEVPLQSIVTQSVSDQCEYFLAFAG